MNIASSTFAARFEELLNSIEGSLDRELSEFEAEGLEQHIATNMVVEGIIQDVSEVLS